MTMYSAYISKVSNDLPITIRNALEFINFRDEVKKDSVVFVKPNFTFPYHLVGVTTSPKLLESLLEELGQRCKRLIVGESNGGNCSFQAERAFREHGMYKMCNDLGAELVNLSKLPAVFIESVVQGKRVKVPSAKIFIERCRLLHFGSDFKSSRHNNCKFRLEKSMGLLSRYHERFTSSKS